ncbi:MAG: hypothetical protein Kow002_10970 [Anaerolineales bacterium]
MPRRILRTPADLTEKDIRALYARFDLPVTEQDCGQQCAPHNPNGIPFCCDICHAVPAAYRSEWKALKKSTKLWHPYRGDEDCASSSSDKPADRLTDLDMPPGMIPLACLGPDRCERENRLLSCRQFPFYPYVSSDYRFLGLAYDWEFEAVCWVVSRLELVSEAYCESFVRTYDHLFALFQDEFESYAIRSEEARAHFASLRRRIPVIHRDGGYRLVSPVNERIYRVDVNQLPRFGPYR